MDRILQPHKRHRCWIAAVLPCLLLISAGCNSLNRLGQSARNILPGSNPPVVKKSESGEAYPNVRFQSPDQPEFKLRETFGENESGSSPADDINRVSKVILKGNRILPSHQILRHIGTREGRFFDPDQLQQDIEKLWQIPEIRRINGPFVNRTPTGVEITIDVVERNHVGEVKFVGNRGLTDRQLKKETGLEDGQPLDLHQIRMAKTRIEDFYKEKGFPRTQVEIIEGTQPNDDNVVFLIYEDQKQRVWNVEFQGNKFVTDARLKNFIKSKPGILKVFGGLVKRNEIEQDVLRLESYYKKFGFFNARIGREVSESNDGRWLTLRFIIDEGPRYQVRNVSFVGNRHYDANELMKLVELKPSEEGAPSFNVAKMNEDVVSLRDLYGGQGFVFVKVEAEPRFLEEPGLMDLVYRIEEGERYRVGKINIRIDGDYGVTKRQVVLNRLALRPGDWIDVRKIRNAERRLAAARIFAGSEPGTGAPPKVVVRPPELDASSRTAQRYGDSSSSFR